MYNFDEIVERKGTNSVKWDQNEVKGHASEVIPMWVADMDFKTLPEITEAIKQRAEHGIFGYTLISEAYLNSVVNWMNIRHQFMIEKEWIVPSPGIVTALKIAVLAYTQPNDAVIINKPVYYPFDFSIENNGRKIIENSMIFENGSYRVDYEDFEKKIIDNDVKMFILCNPYNPIGKVWTLEELKTVGDICKKHHVLVISDEIHHDIVYKGHRHIPFYNVDESYKEFSVICTAPSKTFNLAGLQTSNIIIANESLREKFIAQKDNSGVTNPNFFGIIACQTAYEKGAQWADELIEYLAGNIDFMIDYFEKNIPQCKVIRPDGLFLVWVDFTALGLSYQDLEKFMLTQAKLWLDEGYIFGTGGDGFERFNVACPRATLEKGLKQLDQAIKTLSK